MNIGYILPYRNQYDGIAEYAQEMAHQLESFSQIISIPVVDDDAPLVYPIQIRKNHLADYVYAANYLNRHCDACIIHYSCLGYGLTKGMAILTLSGSLTIPSAVVIHELLGNPDENVRKIIEGFGKHVSNLVAMSQQSADVMMHLCKIPAEKIKLIEYGLTFFSQSSRETFRKVCGYDGRKVIFAHGLVHPGKGIHVLIDAISMVRLKHPEILLHFVGNTHPEENGTEGEKYFSSLKLQIRRAGLENEVIIEHRKPDAEELSKFLCACDIYVNPCSNEQVLQSKSLAEAVVAGAAIVSTSSLYARDLLSDNRGELVPVNNPLVLSEAISQLLNKPNTIDIYRKSSRDSRSIFAWSRIVGKYHKMLDDMCQRENGMSNLSRPLIDVTLIPQWNKSFALQSDFEFQYSDKGVETGSIEGRSIVETHALALMAFLKIYLQYPSSDLMSKINYHLHQLKNMQIEDGNFNPNPIKNTQTNTAEDEVVGLVFCVMAHVVVDAPWVEQRQIAAGILKNAMPAIFTLKTSNGIAASLMGLSIYLKKYEDDSILQSAKDLSNRLQQMFKKNASDEWYWCDEKMGQMPGLIPLALMMAKELLGNKVLNDLSEKSIQFLEQVMFAEDVFFPAGTKRPLSKGRPKAEFDQSAWDAVSMIWLYDNMLNKVSDGKSFNHLLSCYLWFLGENSMRRMLYNHRSGGCAHMLTPGMQSVQTTCNGTFAYMISWALVRDAGCRQYM